MEELIKRLASLQAEQIAEKVKAVTNETVIELREAVDDAAKQLDAAKEALSDELISYESEVERIEAEIDNVSAQIIDEWTGEHKTLKYPAGTLSFRRTGSLRIIDDVRLMELLIEKAPIVDVVSKYIEGFKLTGVKKFVDVPTGVASMEYKTTVGLKTELSG
jgi:hypothetical protein